MRIYCLQKYLKSISIATQNHQLFWNAIKIKVIAMSAENNVENQIIRVVTKTFQVYKSIVQGYVTLWMEEHKCSDYNVNIFPGF